jgi:hypothetical protein
MQTMDYSRLRFGLDGTLQPTGYQSTCPEITWYFCHQFAPDLPIEVQSYYWTSANGKLPLGYASAAFCELSSAGKGLAPMCLLLPKLAAKQSVAS